MAFVAFCVFEQISRHVLFIFAPNNLKYLDRWTISFLATNGTSSPSRHFGSSFGSHSRADYEPVGPSAGNRETGNGQTNGARYSNTPGGNPPPPAGSNEMYDIPVGTF